MFEAKDFYPHTVTGTVERVTYFNDETGYSVLKIKPTKTADLPEGVLARDRTMAVVGVMPQLNVGELAEFHGTYKEDPKWGLQFRAEMMKTVLPTEKRGIKAYLESLSGVGPKTAQKVVDEFQERTLDVLNREPERVHEVMGLSNKLAENLIRAWQDEHKHTQEEREITIFLQTYGVSARFARRIYDEYGEDTVEKVRENPYRLADDIFGIGFLKADSVAQEMGVKEDSAERAAAGVKFALDRLATEGHTYAPRDHLVQTTSELLGFHDEFLFNAVIDRSLAEEALFTEAIVVDEYEGKTEAIYLPRYYKSEVGATKLLITLASQRADLCNDADERVDGLMELSDVELTAQQKGAVVKAVQNKVSVLTGGPGTGKTTTLRMVIDLLNTLDDVTVALCAPTGRAAKRLSEATGQPAYTIHRLLGYDGFEFLHDQHQPLDVDFVVCDETSMLDLILFYNLLKALPARAHLMLVGDIDQLPSVGAGNVLRDIIDSGVAQVTRLTQIHREADDSHIVTNAHRVNNGEMPYLKNESSDFFFFRKEDAGDAATMTVDIVKNRLPEIGKRLPAVQKHLDGRPGFDPVDEVQVLAPMYRGLAGVHALNRALQAELNPNRGSKAEVKRDGQVFRAGDKIMQTRNNYDKNVYNGDAGRIYSIDDNEGVLTAMIDDRLVDYKFSELDQVVLAYCISTHRSQGSEYPVVVLPLLNQHYMMLQRNLLYTAITRARKLVVTVGSTQAIAIAVGNNKVAERYSGLRPRLAAWAGMAFD